MSSYPDIYKPKYITCCGCHVRTFALILGYFLLVLSILGILGSVKTGNMTQFAMDGISTIVVIFLILAHYKENPTFYLPYLILSGIGLILFPFFVVFPVVFAIVILKPNEMAILSMIIMFLLIVELIQIYFWLVVKRAKNYMELEVCTGNAHGPRMFLTIVETAKIPPNEQNKMQLNGDLEL